MSAAPAARGACVLSQARVASALKTISAMCHVLATSAPHAPAHAAAHARHLGKWVGWLPPARQHLRISCLDCTRHERQCSTLPDRWMDPVPFAALCESEPSSTQPSDLSCGLRTRAHGVTLITRASEGFASPFPHDARANLACCPCILAISAA